jgi:hypothetical protein
VNKLVLILSQRRYLVTALVALVAYAFLYLVAAQLLVWQGSIESSASAVHISSDWRALLFRQRAPFLYEPIGVLALGQRLRLYLAVPNLAIALLLGMLVGLNAAVSYHSFRTRTFRGAPGIASLLGTIPALVGGAACCVPTLVLVIGLQMSATLIAVWPLFVPASATLLIVTLWWSLARDARQTSCH